MKPDLESFYKDSEVFYRNLTYGKATYNKAYYEKIKDDEDVFTILNSLYDEIFKGRNKTLEHNAILYREVENLLDTKGKCLVELGTGLGKSTIVLQYLENHPDMRALVIAPNKTIVSDWNSRRDYGYHIEARTYQGLSREYEKNPETHYDSDFDIVILDEVHHMGYDSDEEKGALSWGSAIVNIMSQNVKTIGLSATPERSDGIDVAEYFDGCVCEGMAIDEAIEKNIVHPFSYVTAVYDTDGIIDEFKEENDDPTYKKLIGELNTAVENAPAIETIINKYIGDLDPKTRKGILFVQNTSQIPSVIETVQRCFPTLKIRELHSGLTSDEIANNREWFKNTENGFIVAINMISEGAHYNGVNTIMMFRQTSSYLLYLQQIGRAVTLSSKEDPKTIVFDFVNNIHNIGDYYDTATYETSLPRKILKAIREKAEKHISTQLIVSDESEDLVRCLKKIREYIDNTWEDWEIEFLKNNSHLGVNACTDAINNLRQNKMLCNRSICSVQHKFTILGIYSRKVDYDNIDAILVQHFGKVSKEKLSCLLPNIHYDTLRKRAYKLGLSARGSWTSEEDNILIKFYSTEGAAISSRLPNRTDSAIENRRKALGLKFNNPIYWTPIQIQLLKSRYSEITSDEEFELLCKELGKSSAQVSGKANALNIKKSKLWKSNICKATNGMSRRVLCLESGNIYTSAQEAQRITGCNSSHIIQCCKHKESTCGGYHWEYVKEYRED